MNNSDSICNNKRHRFNHLPNSSVLPRKKRRAAIVNTGFIHIKPLQVPLISTTTSSRCESIRLEPYRPSTIGRNRRRCELVFEDRRVSNRHCQILFDAQHRRFCIADGVFFSGSSECSRVRVSLNGVFVNGVKVGRDEVKELCAGDEVSLVCGNEGACCMGIQIGFVIERIVLMEEVVGRSVSTFRANYLSPNYAMHISEHSGLVARANLLLSRCRGILRTDDPISYIRRFINSYHRMGNADSCKNKNKFLGIMMDKVRFPVGGVLELNYGGSALRKELLPSEDWVNEQILISKRAAVGQLSSVICHRETVAVALGNSAPVYDGVCGDQLGLENDIGSPFENGVDNDKTKTLSSDSIDKENAPNSDGVMQDKRRCGFILPPGNKFYLNRLMGHAWSDNHTDITLPELLYPVESLTRIFIATFTSDILWYPPFPEIIAFGKDRKKLGIACHHPKLLVLQREDTIRVVLTSANLVAKQWNNVTNTVWWQDFPRTTAPDYFSLFTQTSAGEVNQDSKSDFAAQLAGFMASLVIDVPSQAHWIVELTNYDFKGATGHLVASIPGIYSHRAPFVLETMHFLYGNQSESRSFGVKFLGSVEASVVGLSHLFRTSVDSNGAQVKKLAALLGKCRENVYGMTQIILRRNTTIPADVNAVSVLGFDADEFSEGDCIQIGFLPKNVAKWVAPLWDVGLFRFFGYIYPKEVLAAAIEGSNNKVQLILYLSQGPSFSDISKVMQPEHVPAICSLVASIQRCTGLWRLQEVLAQHKWPEHLETDFIYGSSSIGSVNAQFLAAFSAAAGKKSLRFSESEESDPDWGCWSASQESRHPSIRIIFPTIDRVKNGSCGILASKYILCFSQKTWQRLRNIDILHDSIPYPNERVGHPMHSKVARRRFQSKTDGSSFGWVYCGSHNFSAAAWGRSLSNSPVMKANGAMKTNSVLGPRLHICNYELGIVFVVPPSDMKNDANQRSRSLDEIILPFVVPAPKYRSTDRPATAQAMREALAELTEREREKFVEASIPGELMEEEIPDEEDEVLEAADYITEEKEDEKAYAETLWSQVDSYESC
ncbi:uncharacterized protein LOC132281011 isoform X2 [Cornus florida]|uniref:uncharacterized protein LOC132281011 isoform X2 n=1 Tax=Cornus florida TaxID=4283 RepID=UPI0028A0B409|nr:uncharacterized protein LOC132281011 isoform X2 [Cornus florida]